MLIRLMPDQIMKYWPQIRDCILAAIPPVSDLTEDALLVLQSEFLSGEMDAWIGATDDGVYGVATTKIVVDDPSLTRNLLIYSVTMIDDAPASAISEGLQKLKQYAIGKRCRRVIAYSNNEKLLSIARRLKGDDSYRIIYFDIEGGEF